MSLGRVVVMPLASPATAPWLGRLAAMLAEPDGGTVVAVSVVTDDPRATRDDASRAVDGAAAAAQGMGVAARGVVLHSPDVPAAVLAAMEEHAATLAVMGWQGHSSAHNVFGALIDSIMGRSRVPLAVVRPAHDDFRRVLVPLGDAHLTDAGARGVGLAADVAGRLRRANQSSLVVVRSGRGDQPLPSALRHDDTSTLQTERDLPSALRYVHRRGDMIVAPVAPTGEGLREATTHIAWATPDCWQVVALDMGPATGDVADAVRDAGMLVEPVPEQTEDITNLVEVAVTVDPSTPDPWNRVETAIRLVGTVRSHTVATVQPDPTAEGEGGEAGEAVVHRGVVEIMAPSPAAALSALMGELDDVRWQIHATSVDYRLVDPPQE